MVQVKGPILNSDARDAHEDVARVICFSVSLVRQDGGGQRLTGFLHALRADGLRVETLDVGPRAADTEHAVSSRLLHRAKRRLLPVPMRSRIEAELTRLNAGGPPTISLVPSANRWALRSDAAWLDFSDLWSNYALNHAATVDPLSAACNRAQARLWSSREAAESELAAVVTVASWSDHLKMGKKAVWLPHPVVNAPASRTIRKASIPLDTGLVYGLIANFDYPPNRDAYERLIRQWLPVLLPSARQIVVAGFGSERLPRVANVDIAGPVDKVAGFYDRIDVALAPVERGGGMKVKVVEAMMHGVPVIATEHAKDGLPDAVAAECLDFKALSADMRIPASWLRDPRENPDTASALNSFTYESFQNTVNRLWKERMARYN